MGDENSNVRALLRAQKQKDMEGGLHFDGNQTSPIQFTHPIGVIDPTLGDLSSSIGCMGSLHTKENPHEVRFSGRQFFLSLDPQFTAPNALIGVMFLQTSNINQHVLMSPGNIIHVPQGFSNCWCYDAALVKEITASDPAVNASKQLGFVRFVASQTRECLVDYNQQETHPQASAIGYQPQLGIAQLGPVTALGWNNLLFSPNGLKEIIVSLWGRNVAGSNSRAGWSCGIGLFALERNVVSWFATPRVLGEMPLQPRINVNTDLGWKLVDIKVASGIGKYSTWAGPTTADEGSDIIVFDTFPHSTLLQIARVSPINSFDAVETVGQISALVEGRRESTGHKYEKVKTIYDATSAANTALNTGTIDTAEFEHLSIDIYPSGAIAAGILPVINDLDENAGSSALVGITTIASGLPMQIEIGPGMQCATPTGLAVVGYSTHIVPKRITGFLPALGAGITGRMRIVGRTRG